MNWLYLQKRVVKTRYFIFIAYRGSAYHGWQVQPNSVTIQAILDKSLSVILNEPISTIGAGRTDTGVHATYFCAHFDCSSELLEADKNLIYKLNRFLPKDVAVKVIKRVIPDANARFSAISRTYKYYITTVKDPFLEDFAWFVYGDLNVDLMNSLSDTLSKYTDFTSFSKLHSGSKTNICSVHYAVWQKEENKLVFTIKADRFLRNMVRSIVGTMIDVGSGKICEEQFRQIIEGKDRCLAGFSAPAKGLFLTNIEYPDEIFV